jgi:hypothetical protein
MKYCTRSPASNACPPNHSREPRSGSRSVARGGIPHLDGVPARSNKLATQAAGPTARPSPIVRIVREPVLTTQGWRWPGTQRASHAYHCRTMRPENGEPLPTRGSVAEPPPNPPRLVVVDEAIRGSPIQHYDCTTLDIRKRQAIPDPFVVRCGMGMPAAEHTIPQLCSREW